MAMRRGELLDQSFLALSASDYATFRDFAQNVLVTGATGAGKTSGPGRILLESLAKSGAGGIVLCAKPGEAGEVCAILARAGRAGSVIVWNGRNHGFNFLEYALARLGTDGLNSIIEYLTRIVEMIRNASALRGGDGDAFWLDELKRMLRNILLPVYLSTGTLRLRDIMAFARSGPISLDQLNDTHWRQSSFFFSTLQAIAAQVDDATGERLIGYWREFAQMDGRLRGSILAGFTMLDRLDHGWLGEALGGRTTLVPELCFHGTILVIDTPRATLGEDGVILAMIVKDAFQTAVLGRNALAEAHRVRPVFCYADECQEVVTSRDAEVLAMSRSSRCATIYLTQSLPSLYAKLGGPTAHDRVHQLVGNMGVRIFCANHCHITNQWAADTMGKMLHRRASYNETDGSSVSYGMNIGEGTNQGTNRSSSHGFSAHAKGGSSNGSSSFGTSEGSSENWGRNRGSSSNYGTSQGFSEQLGYILEPDFFSRGLKTGGPANGNRVSCVWYQAGRHFNASGSTALLTEFAQ